MPGFPIQGDGLARSNFSTSGFHVTGDVAGTSNGEMPSPTEDYAVRYDYKLQRKYKNSLNVWHTPTSLALATEYGTGTYSANETFEDSSEPLSLDLPFATEFASLYPGETLASVEYWIEFQCRGFYLDSNQDEQYISLGGFAEFPHTTI